MNKDVTALLRSIDHIDGVEIRQTRNGHFAVYKDGLFVSIVPGTPSDHRWRENTLADLRRAGITPAVRPVGKAIAPQSLMSVEEIRTRLRAMHPRAEFARFLVNDLPVLAPKLRTYRTTDAAESSFYQILAKGGRPSNWAHLLLDQGIRQWDRNRRAQLEAVGMDSEQTELVDLEQPERSDGEALTLRLRLDTLNELLGRLGIRVEIDG